jgi:hypothetical protein
VPYYSHVQAYAHPYTEWPPMSESSFLFLDKRWRRGSPRRYVEGLDCDCEIESIAIDMNSVYATRTQDWKDEATRWFNHCGGATDCLASYAMVLSCFCTAAIVRGPLGGGSGR